MLVGELVVRRNNIKRKIEELKEYITALSSETGIEPVNKGALYSKAINDLFELYTQLQTHTALLDSENLKSVLNIKKGTEITVADAVHVRKTVMAKLSIYDELIENNDLALSIVDLMDKRDKVLEEYIILDAKINESDWASNV